MEILAPVGGFKQLQAALAAKADAIYIGSDKFSARAGAENFSIEDIESLVKACHHEKIKVYLAINTLFKNSEILNALDLAIDAWNIGVDALIIQDFGLVHLLEKYYPEIEKHASTQMSIHNLEGAKFARNKGITRVVLARELSLEEISEINKIGIETEVFVHGAICISYSGQCLFSSLNGNRSANRGRCAQPCRKPYKLLKNGKELDQGFLISPKDRAYINNMESLKKSGIASFKIEGRLRNEYYVYEGITQYKNALRNKAYSIEKLGQIFKRDAFSEDYLYSNPRAEFITKEGGSNKGLLLGRMKKSQIELLCDLELSDGIKSSKGGFILTKILQNGKSIRQARKGDVVELFPKKYAKHDTLYKTTSVSQKKSIDEVIANYQAKQNIVEVDVDFVVGEELTISNGELSVLGGLVEKAEKSPVLKEKIIENIEKSGSDYTKLQVKNINIEEGFIRIKEINQARREFIKSYEDKYLSNKKTINKIGIENKWTEEDEKKKTKWGIKLIIISKKKDLHALDSSLTICLNPFSKGKNAICFEDVIEVDKRGIPYYVKVPTIVRKEMNEILAFLENLENVEGVITANLGIINRLKGKMKIIGYYDLNIMNSYSIDFFEDLDYIIPSIEMTKDELHSLENKEKLIPFVYGNVKYMNMEYSPVIDFDEDEENEYVLEENRRKTLIQKDIYDRTTLYSYDALNHSYRLQEYQKMGFQNFIIEPLRYKNIDHIMDNFNKEKGFLTEELFHYEKAIL